MRLSKHSLGVVKTFIKIGYLKRPNRKDKKLYKKPSAMNKAEGFKLKA